MGGRKATTKGLKKKVLKKKALKKVRGGFESGDTSAWAKKPGSGFQPVRGRNVADTEKS